VQLPVLNSAVLASVLLFLPDCKVSGTGVATLTDDGMSHRSSAWGSHAVDILQKCMTEEQVAAALEVTHADQKRFLFTGPTQSVRYICRGRRYPDEYLDCEFSWGRTASAYPATTSKPAIMF
jgi:hypothetical protein